MAIAFFDLDLTLLSVNSASLWIKRELRLGQMSKWYATKAAYHVLRYQLGTAALEPVLERAITRLKGLDEAEIEAQTRAFYEEEIVHRFRPGALEVIEAHRNAGDQLVLLTSSSPYLSRLVVEKFGFADFLSNRFVTECGVFTGVAKKPLCYGAGKAFYAQEFAARAGQSLDESHFYTDSYSDLPALKVVGKPVCVHPDRKLRRYAQGAGWPIVDWGTA